MEQSSSSETDGCSASQELLHLLWSMFTRAQNWFLSWARL